MFHETPRLILLLDNYDSFVHNLARYFNRLGYETEVVRNDACSAEELRKRKPRAVVISPGPCAPAQAGNSIEAVLQFMPDTPILGVCLGHQVIAEALGGRIVRASEPMHGRTSEIRHANSRLFVEIPSPFTVCRYHSLVVEPESLPSELQIVAETDDGTIMAIEHSELPLFGVQFHPEAVLTDHGYRLLGNFLRIAGLDPPSKIPTGETPPQAIPAVLPAQRHPPTF